MTLLRGHAARQWIPSQTELSGFLAPQGIRHALPRNWQTDNAWKTLVPERRQLGHGVCRVVAGAGRAKGTTGLISWEDLWSLTPGLTCCDWLNNRFWRRGGALLEEGGSWDEPSPFGTFGCWDADFCCGTLTSWLPATGLWRFQALRMRKAYMESKTADESDGDWDAFFISRDKVRNNERHMTNPSLRQDTGGETF